MVFGEFSIRQLVLGSGGGVAVWVEEGAAMVRPYKVKGLSR
jgi:hypothetical protein